MSTTAGVAGAAAEAAAAARSPLRNPCLVYWSLSICLSVSAFREVRQCSEDIYNYM